MPSDKKNTIWKNLDVKSLKGEKWKDVREFEGMYMVSNMGRIKSYPKQYNSYKYKIIKIFSYRGKTLRVRLYKNGKPNWRCVTILVAKEFCENPLNKKFVQINDGDGFNARSNNLKWATRGEYLSYAYKTGKCCKKGEKSINHKLKENQVLDIFNSPKKRVELAKEYNISINTINSIKTGHTWSYLTNKTAKNRKQLLKKDQVLEIFWSNLSLAEISKRYKISRSSINRIKRGESWGNITKNICSENY